ncbi:amidohydrolase family protein [Streptomyces sp. NPDC127108]|uniref:amidohydrolase family protein n=1 Tax=Streptomyces sp. NPDC127108 TaxID=3345361 RepID=UPI00362F5934
MPHTGYDGPVIDPHMHLWDFAADVHPWLSPANFSVFPGIDKLQHDYLVDSYLADTAGQSIVASVHVEALWDAADDPVNETRWLQTLPKDRGVAQRYVAACPFGTPSTESTLRVQAAFDRVVGVRQTIGWHPDPQRSWVTDQFLTRNPDWRQGVETTRELGLLLEFLMFPWQAEQVVDLARAFPEVTMVVNHAASPMERGAADLAAWQKNIAELAAADNVAIKISALGTYDPRPTDESFAFVIDTIVNAFGADRAMFASDFPVGSIHLSFDDIYGYFRRVAGKYSPVSQAKLFHDTARRLYRL